MRAERLITGVMKEMKKIRMPAALLLAALMLLSACGVPSAKTESEQPAGEAPAAAPAQAEAAAPAEAEEVPAVPLTEEELQKFTELFASKEYSGFLAESFRDAEDIDWNAVLRDGGGIAITDVSEAETADYLKATGQGSLYADLYVLRRGDLQAYAKNRTGAEFRFEANDLADWDYIPENDSFYRLHWYDEGLLFDCVSGEKAGDVLTLRFRANESSPGADPRSHTGPFADRVLTVRETADGCVMLSNAIQWDDGCDPAQSFDVEMPQYDEPVRFLTYPDPHESTFLLTKGGKYLVQLSAWVSTGFDSYLTGVAAVGFFDFDADGRTDILVIGDAADGRHALLYQAVTDGSEFVWFADLDEAKAKQIGRDMTVAGIRQALTGGQAPGTWQEAYAQIAKLYQLAGEEYRYDLIYADGDEVPELAADLGGYGMTLFTWENGHTRCLMNHWGYGAMGNHGYSYAPGTGVYYNSNADYAGAVVYEYYMSKHEEGELATDYWLRRNNFNDADGDGEPSAEELETYGYFEGTAEYHSNLNPGMPQEGIRAMVELYESYDWQFLTGTLDVAGLMAKLH